MKGFSLLELVDMIFDIHEVEECIVEECSPGGTRGVVLEVLSVVLVTLLNILELVFKEVHVQGYNMTSIGSS